MTSALQPPVEAALECQHIASLLVHKDAEVRASGIKIATEAKKSGNIDALAWHLIMLLWDSRNARDARILLKQMINLKYVIEVMIMVFEQTDQRLAELPENDRNPERRGCVRRQCHIIGLIALLAHQKDLVGQDVVDFLIEKGLMSKVARVRLTTCHILPNLKIAPMAGKSVPILLMWLTDQTGETRTSKAEEMYTAAAATLIMLSHFHRSVLSGLLKVVNNPAELIREAGSRSEAEVEGLLELVRLRAIDTAINSHEATSPKTRPRYANVLSGDNWLPDAMFFHGSYRSGSHAMLVRFLEMARGGAARCLQVCLDDPRELVRHCAAMAVQELALSDRTTLMHLVCPLITRIPLEQGPTQAQFALALGAFGALGADSVQAGLHAIGREIQVSEMHLALIGLSVGHFFLGHSHSTLQMLRHFAPYIIEDGTHLLRNLASKRGPWQQAFANALLAVTEDKPRITRLARVSHYGVYQAT